MKMIRQWMLLLVAKSYIGPEKKPFSLETSEAMNHADLLEGNANHLVVE